MAFLVCGEDIELDTLEELILFLKDLARKGQAEGGIHSRYVYDLRGADPVLKKAAVVSLGGDFGCLEVWAPHQEKEDWYIFLDTPERSQALFKQVVNLWPAASFEHLPCLYQGDTIHDGHDLLDHGFLPAEMVWDLVEQYFGEDITPEEIACAAGLTLRWFSGLYTERMTPYQTWGVNTENTSDDAD